MPSATGAPLVVAPGPDTPLSRVAGIGPRHSTRLMRLGVASVRDLLLHLPRRYEDTTDIRALRELVPGPEQQTVRARVASVTMRRSPFQRTVLVEAMLEDGGARVGAIWFNQPFLRDRLREGDELVLSGRARLDRQGRLQLQNPTFETVSGEQRHVGRLAPVYPETDGLTSRWLREHIEPLLPLADDLPDPVPPALRAEEDLLPLGAAIRFLHKPESLPMVDRARDRIAFGEVLLLQLAALRARRRRLAGSGVVVPYDVDAARRLVASLPFALTQGQRVAAHHILTDLAAPGAMSRLLEGDVGSGKTAVAAMAAHMAAQAGLQTLVMAPTEILARQHHVTLDRMLAPHGVSVRLLVGSTPTRARREILSGVAGGVDSVLVGTHALVEDEVAPAQLALIVVDEQHRFGVAQRQALRRKAELMPNFLAMTATPIPRSLALTLYGDVDLSELRDMPPGRTPIQTRVVPPQQRDEAYAFVRQEVAAGRQAFVICPLVEGSDKLEATSAVDEHARLSSAVFPDLRVELLHGRMPAREKDERMQRFAKQEADILVSTSVVEVGVDVPNATVILVEGAERFGLAQLHQLRGRVGRGAHAGACLLFQGSLDEAGQRRLAAIASTTSGFELAELDLRLRGPGDVVGLRQHGLPEMQAADLLDMGLLRRAQLAASRWLDSDPALVTHPPLAEAMLAYRNVFDLD